MAEEELFVVPDTNGSEFNKDGWPTPRNHGYLVWGVCVELTATRRVLENVLLYRTLTLRHGLLNVSRRSVSLQEDLAQYPRVPRVVFRRNAMFKPFGDRDPLGSPYPWCPQIEYTPPDATPVKPGWRLYALTDRRMILGQDFNDDTEGVLSKKEAITEAFRGFFYEHPEVKSVTWVTNLWVDDEFTVTILRHDGGTMRWCDGSYELINPQVFSETNETDTECFAAMLAACRHILHDVFGDCTTGEASSDGDIKVVAYE